MPDDGKPIAGSKDPAPAVAVVANAKTLNLHLRLLAVMNEVDYVQKDKTIDQGGGYKVVTHDAVTAKVRPALVKHRVVYYPQNMRYVQNGNRTEMQVDIKFVNADSPEDFVAVPSVGFGIDNQDKGPGKAVSYAVKMALLKALGLETGVDADDDSNLDHQAPDRTPAPVAPQPRTMTKQQARPEYDALLKEMLAQQNPTDLAAWGAKSKARSDLLPEDWQKSLRNEYADHKSSLTRRAGQ